MTNDIVTRVVAGAILIIAFGAAMAIIVHGYWETPTYTVPPVIAGIVVSGVTVSGTILGVHIGVTSAMNGSAAGTTAAVAASKVNGVEAAAKAAA